VSLATTPAGYGTSAGITIVGLFVLTGSSPQALPSNIRRGTAEPNRVPPLAPVVI